MIQLRDYQQVAVDSILSAIADELKAGLIGMFTGAGKTVIFCEAARRVHEQLGGRTLIIVPLRELAWQAADKVRQVAGLDPGMEMAEFRVSDDDLWENPSVVVASKQTLVRGRYKKFTDISLVIVDEAHLQYTDAALEMLKWFQAQGTTIIGFTATPFLMDGRAMKDFYTPLCNYDISWAIEHGWAVPPVCKLAKVSSLDLSGIKIQGGDFDQKQLRQAIEAEANLHRIALITASEMKGPTVVFTPSVASAKGVQHYLANNYDVEAEVVWGTQPEEERQEAIARFKTGRAQVLVNCAVVAVGFDHPKIETLILARPTKSRSFWLQCVGRATRPLAGTVDFEDSTPEARREAIAASKKPEFRIIDCTDASLDHRLVTAVDMFCTERPKEIVEAVKKQAADADKPLTPAELEQLAREEEERRRIAAEIERRRKEMQGRARGQIVQREFTLEGAPRRSIGTYRNPLRGKHAGKLMSQLPIGYLHWATKLDNLAPWIRQNFTMEIERRGRTAARN